MNFLPIIFSLLAGDSRGEFAKLLQNVLGGIVPARTAADAKPLDLKWAQEQLKAAGFDPGPIDGKLGPLTMAATRAYQAARPGLAVDGWIGPATMTKLIEDAAKRA